MACRLDFRAMPSSLADLKRIGLIAALRKSDIFSSVTAAELNAIADCTVARSAPKGTYLFREGDPSLGFYIVQSGAINVHRVNAAGKEQVIHVFRAGESFAEGTLGTDKGYPADARAIEQSQVLLVQKPAILSLLRAQPDLALRLLGSMSSHLRILVAQLEDLTLKDVETRLANWLVKRCPPGAPDEPVRIALPMTKSVLAAEIGTVSETLSRTFAKFREQGLIEVNGNSINVVSARRLSELLRRNLGE